MRCEVAAGSAKRPSASRTASANQAPPGTTSEHEQLRVRCFDGTSKQLVASASPLFGVRGQIVGAVVVIRDLTESKQIEEQLEMRVARLVSIGVELEQSVHARRA